MQVRESTCVGIGGANTGAGLFTVRPIPANTFVCAYAPTASLRRHDPNRYGDYLMTFQREGFSVDVDGAENEYETGLGRICNDGSFPFFLAGSKFSRLVAERCNCEFAKRKGCLWVKSKRYIQANEELFVRYTEDGRYWKSLFSDDQLNTIRRALQTCPATLHGANEVMRALSI